MRIFLAFLLLLPTLVNATPFDPPYRECFWDDVMWYPMSQVTREQAEQDCLKMKRAKRLSLHQFSHVKNHWVCELCLK